MEHEAECYTGMLSHWDGTIHFQFSQGSVATQSRWDRSLRPIFIKKFTCKSAGKRMLNSGSHYDNLSTTNSSLWILSKSSAFWTVNFHTASQCINALQPTLLYRKRFLGNILKKNIENWSTLPNLRRMIKCHGVYTLCSEKKHPLTFSSYLHEWCVDLNKNCSEYT